MYQNQQHQQDTNNQSPYKGNFEQKLQQQQQQQQQNQQQNGQQSISKQIYQQVQLNPQQPQTIQNGMGASNGNGNGNMNGLGRTQIIHTPVSNTGKYKTSICRHFRNGNCQLGTTCHFAHGNDEMRTVSDPLPQNIPQQPKVVCNNFKTVKCRYYERGFCKNQNACCFAHGETDLAQLPPYGVFGAGNAGNSNSLVSHLQPQITGPQPSKMTDSILLIQILQNLEKVFSSDQGILENLQYAQQIAKQGDQKGAFIIISNIMKDPKRTEEEKTQYNTIYNNAQMYYNHFQQYVSHGMMQSYPQMQTQYLHPAVQDVSFYSQQPQFLQPQQQLVQKQLSGNIQQVQYHGTPMNLQIQQQQQQLSNIQFQSQI